MELNLEIVDLGLLIKDKGILIFSDFHIGYEEALNKKGVLVPRFQFKGIIKRLTKIFLRLKKDKVKLKIIIINGDIKHEFGAISDQEWRETLKLLDFLAKHCKEIVLVKGNHDTILGPIAKKKKVSVVDYYFAEDVLITHGNKIPEKEIMKKAKIIIIGHEHPAVSLREDVRTEKFKCFLKGKWKNKKLIVMPSFCLATEGTDILRDRILSPFLKQKLNEFKVLIVADKIYDFGKVKNLL